MNKKSILLLVLIAVFAIIIGVSYSYFIGEINFKGNGSKVYGSMREIDGVQITVEGVLNFEDDEDTFEGYTGIFPGHQNVAVIKVTAEGNGSSAEFKLVWNGFNGLETDLNYYVYKYEGDEPSSPSPSIACEIKEESASLGNKKIYETCERTGFENLETVQTSGNVIPGKMSLQTFTLVENETIITTKDNPTVVYYYVVLEYPNKEGSQNNDMLCDNDETCEFSGEVTVEKNGTQLADISFTKIYKHDSNNEYVQSSTIPQKGEGYVLNENKSTCGENTTLIWDEDKWEISLNSLTGSNQCELYFDRTCGTSCQAILEGKTISTRSQTKTEFTNTITSSTTGVIYEAEENDGNTYYFAGAPTDNYVKFAGYYWRIIRINYDGTIRMIYAGTSATASGASLSYTTSKYNDSSTIAEYTGYKYTVNMMHGNTESSTIKGVLENFYTTKLASNEEYIDKNAGFCNDRSVASGAGVGATTSSYKAQLRVMSSTNSNIPTFNCENENDLFTSNTASTGNRELTYPLGLITADEVAYAGGVYDVNNTSYYLYSSQYYWTMTPNRYESYARVFVNGAKLSNNKTETSYGVRPVINLRADLILKGEGTSTSPYVVEGVSN
ncbi:MAG: hypothetical protein E7163_00490 [Firmicutes bacterium]|nr:hypothetical protein [Bacillota bacterium]